MLVELAEDPHVRPVEVHPVHDARMVPDLYLEVGGSESELVHSRPAQGLAGGSAAGDSERENRLDAAPMPLEVHEPQLVVYTLLGRQGRATTQVVGECVIEGHDGRGERLGPSDVDERPLERGHEQSLDNSFCGRATVWMRGMRPFTRGAPIRSTRIVRERPRNMGGSIQSTYSAGIL